VAQRGVGVTQLPAPCVEAVDLAAVRVALTTTLEAVTFEGSPLRVNAWFADVLNPPCALIGAFTIDFADQTWASLVTLTCPVRLVVPASALRPAQLALDEIAGLFYGAIAADPSLGGVVRRVAAVRATPVTTTRGNETYPSYDAETLVIL
jgi:hypothetical protein